MIEREHTLTTEQQANQLREWQTKLHQGHIATVRDEVQLALQDRPNDRDLMYLKAVACRLLGGIDDALAVLQQMELLYSRYPRIYQERGHCYVFLRNAEKAIESFEKAVSLNTCLSASWQALMTLYRMKGLDKKVQQAQVQLKILNELPVEVLTAFSMYADGEIQQAEDTIRQFLLKNGNHIEAMRLLAKIGTDMNVTDDAEFLLSSILKMNPTHDTARYEHAVVLLKQHKHKQAMEEINFLLGKSPKNISYKITLASIYAGMGNYERAIPLFENLIKEDGQNPELHLAIGHAYKTQGDQEKAIRAYKQAIQLQTTMGEAYWSLANLKTYQFSEAEIDSMKNSIANQAISNEDRFHLCFALGKALEDQKQYETSFKFYDQGNYIKRTNSRYRPEIIENSVRVQTEICDAAFFQDRSHFGCREKGPIFIVGLPRSGSTLIEQILASHSQIEGTMELAEIPRFVGELQGRSNVNEEPRYPKILAEMTADECATLGYRYIEETKIYRTGKPYFIDKMPNNFRHIGLIKLILPNAKIIDARRNPLDCCFSNFKQLFAQGQEFTYSFDDIARYYASYLSIMNHWDKVLPGAIFKIDNETLIDHFEESVQSLMNYLELDLESACLEFYKTSRRVHTASSEQVRKPINKDGVDQWKKYESWLAPLIDALHGYGVISRP
jgi:tetratricopeptide (TPR) repeat protein